MNILLVAPFTQSPRWGVENAIYNLVEGLILNNKLLDKHNIHITILSNADNVRNVQFTHFKIIKMSRPHVPLAFHKDILKSFSLFLNRDTLLRELVDSSDIIHSHNIRFSFPIFQIVHFCCPRKRLIHNFHGLPWREKIFKSTFFRNLDYAADTMRAKILVKLSNVEFIAISKYVKDEIKEVLGAPSYRVHLLYNPISSDFFGIKKSELDGLIFYPARLIPLKNHVPLIKALGLLKQQEKFSEFTLVLAGNFEDTVYQRLLFSLIKKYDLQKNVVFTGFLPKEKLFYYYSRASIVPVISLEETFSLAAIEGMATSTPIIASPVGVIPEVINNGHNGFIVNPNNIEQLKNLLYLLLLDHSLRRRIGKNAKKTAISFRSDFIAKDLIRLWIGKSKT